MIACLTLIAFEIAMLLDTKPWLDYFLGPNPLQNQPSPKIGEITRATDGVRGQSAGELAWEAVSAGNIVRELDRVTTPQTGEVEVAFLDGMGLVAGPNSLIELSRAQSGASGPVRIRLLRGTLRRSKTRGEGQFDIWVGNSRVLTSAQAEFSVRAQEGEQPQVLLSSGTAELVTPSQTFQIQQGQKAVIDSDAASQGAPEIIQTPFTPVSPAPEERIAQSQQERRLTVAFQWVGLPGSQKDEPLLLEVAADIEFKQLVGQLRIPATSRERREFSAPLSIAVPSLESRYFWRVSGVRSGESTEAFPFWITPTKQPGAWKQTPLATAAPQAEHPVNQAPAVPKAEPKRKTPAKKSAPRIEEEDIPPPPDVDDAKVDMPIKPGKKRPRTSFWNWLVPDVWADDSTGETVLVTISWKEVKGIQRYKIQISSDREFGTVVEERDIEGTIFEWQHRSQASDQRYYYRVASMTRSGKVGGFSKPKVVRLPGMILEEDEDAEKDSAASTIVVLPTQRPPEAFRFVMARLGVESGAGSHYQWSPPGSNLTEVALSGLAFRNRVHLESGAGADASRIRFLSLFQLDLAGFRTPASSLLVQTPSRVAVLASLDLFRILESGFGFGGSVDLSYRFLKDSPQTLGLGYGVSAGPSIVWRASLPDFSRLIPYEHRLLARLPFTGLLYGHHMALTIDSSTRWRIFGSEKWSLDTSLDVRGAISAWIQTQTTLSLDASFGVSAHAKWSL